MRLLTLLVLCFLGIVPARAESTADRFTLENGLEVVVIPSTRVPAVAHMIWYRAGSLDEPPGKSGIAHFLEHLMFKGTQKIPPGEFARIIAKHGGRDNAFTSYDYTAYFQLVPKEHLPLMMELEADRMVNLRLDPKIVATERDVILEERSSRVDNDPGAILIEEMKAALYRHSRYGFPVIGWRHEMAALSPEDALAFYRSHYMPNNAFVILAGDITAEEARALTEKHYGALKPGTLPLRSMVQEPPHSAAIRLNYQHREVREPEWKRLWLAPSYSSPNHEHALPLAVLTHVLGGSDTSRLHQALVVNQKLAAAVESDYDLTALSESMFAIRAAPAKGVSLEKLEQAVEKTVAGILAHGITEEELTRAKRLARAEMIYTRDSLSGLAFFYGRALASGVPLNIIESWPEQIDKITAAQVLQAARFVLTKPSVTGVLEKGGKL